MRLSPHTAFHRLWRDDYWLSLHWLLSQFHRYCASTLTDVNGGYDFPLNASASSAFHVPMNLSVHLSVGRFCEPVSWDVPVTHQEGSTVVNLLVLTDMTRTFETLSEALPHSNHR